MREFVAAGVWLVPLIVAYTLIVNVYPPPLIIGLWSAAGYILCVKLVDKAREKK